MSFDLRALWQSAGGRVPDSWDVVTLESLLRDSKSIGVGVMYPGPDTPGGVPLIKVGDIKDGTITTRPTYCISEKTNHEYRRTQLEGDELLITLVGNPGECVVVRPYMAGWNPARAIAVLRLQHPSLRTYLKAVLESKAGRHLIDAVLNTTVQKTLNLKDIKRLPIPLPPSGAIKSITEIAEAFASRITLLHETNATLESIAQTLFKSWFIDFDPVRARGECREPDGLAPETAALFPDGFEESELGPVPKGWKVKPISEMVAGIYDGPHATPPEASNGPIFLGIKNLTGTNLDFSDLRHIGEENWAQWTRRVTPQAGDIVFSYEATLGFFALIPPDIRCCLGRRLALVRPLANRGCAHFWFHQFIAVPFQRLLDKHTVHGATVNRIALREFPSFEVLAPCEEIRVLFDEAVAPLWARIHTNLKQAKALAELRDTLIPRMISGQLRLPDVEDMLKDAA